MMSEPQVPSEEGLPPDAEAPPPAPQPISELLVRQLRALDRELEETLPRVVRAHGSAPDTEAIHDMRVAVRRIRTTLKLARPVFGRFWVDYVRAAFTVLHRGSGALRDEEVLGETLGDLKSPPKALTVWRNRRASHERKLRREMVAAVKQGAVGHARHLLDALLTLPVKPRNDEDQTRFAKRAVTRARKRVESLCMTDTSDVLGLHELRIAYKELRYAAEILEEALPEELAALRKPAATFQKRLGEIHDYDMALVSIARARGLDTTTRIRVLAALRRGRGAKVGKYLLEGAPKAPEPEAQVTSAEG